jgi:hypothetical protein
VKLITLQNSISNGAQHRNQEEGKEKLFSKFHFLEISELACWKSDMLSFSFGGMRDEG